MAGLFYASLYGQTSRNTYRDAYKAWKQADPELEREAAAGGAALGGRADRLAAAAAKYVAARQAFLEGWAARTAAPAVALAAATAAGETESVKAVAKSFQALVKAQSDSLGRTIETFKADPDPGIQQLRQAMEGEQAALLALNESIGVRQKAVASGAQTSTALAQARAKVEDQFHAIGAALLQAAGETGKLTAAWTAYYQKLGDAARGPATPPATGPTKPAGTPPPRELRTAGVAPVPLARYVGAWVFPEGGSYLFAKPESIDLVVNEGNGHVSGTLFGRFKLPAGTAGDPVLRFDFSGDLQNKRNQVFTLLTSDGASGTIELIPGPAFNLLEVTFHTDPKPGKIRQANMVLVKK